MENAGYIALSRQMTLRREMDVIANNMANLNTPAYKGESMLFVEYLETTDSGEKMSFVQDIALVRNLTEGQMTATDNPLDTAISGDAYYEVETPLGARYTRNGAFRLNADNELVTVSGDKVLDEGGNPIVLPPNSRDVTITRDGTVETDQGPAGTIGLVHPLDTPFMIDLKDRQALENDIKRAERLGFQGKLCIHPNQIDACNLMFSPSAREIEFARKVVQAFDEAQARGAAVIQLEGKFVDAPIVARCSN